LMTFSSPEPALMSASLKKRDSPQTWKNKKAALPPVNE
jgi:hypothetical protein